MRITSTFAVAVLGLSLVVHYFDVGNLMPVGSNKNTAIQVPYSSVSVTPLPNDSKRDDTTDTLKYISNDRQRTIDRLLAYTPPQSAWLARERQRALTKFSDKTYDLLVVPFQIDGNALDATSRSLMTMSVAQRISNGTSLKVADPLLVARVLGSSARTIAIEDIKALADKLQVSQVVVGSVGHDGRISATTDGRFSLQAHILRKDESGGWNEDSLHRYSETVIPFSFAEPPYHAFLSRRDKLIRSVLSSEIELTDQKKHYSRRPELSLSEGIVDSLATSKIGGIKPIHTLQLLGTLHAARTSSRERALLFERSLVLLEEFDSTSEDYSLLRARALAQLNRRVAAVSILEGVQEEQVSPEIEWLKRYLHGNLSDRDYRKLGRSASSLDIIDKIENTRLIFEYGREPKWDSISTVTDSLSEEWRYMVAEAILDQYVWQEHSNGPLKYLMDLGFHDPELSMAAIQMRLTLNSDGNPEKEFTRAALKHADSIALQDKNITGLYPCVSDLADIFRNAAAENTIQRINRYQHTLGKPMLALQVVEDQMGYFEGHPDLAIVSGLLVKEHGKPQRKRDDIKMAVNGLLWSGARTEFNESEARNIRTIDSEYRLLSHDQRQRLTFANDWPQPANSGTDCLITSIFGHHCLVYQVNVALENNDVALVSSLLETNEHRFGGHPGLLDFRYRAYNAIGDQAGMRAVQELVLSNRTSEWSLYHRVAMSLLHESSNTEAVQVIKKYPGFHEPGHASSVVLVNRLFEFGSHLWWAGAYEQAREIYEMVGQYSTGAASQMAARVRLALLDGDFDAAINETMNRARRYRSKYATRDLIGLLAHRGDLDQAANVMGSVEVMDEPEYWTAALILQRAREYSTDQTMAWLNKDDPDLGPMQYLVPRHIFQSHVVDREVPKELAKWIRDRYEHESQVLLDTLFPNGIPEENNGGFDLEAINARRINLLPILAADAISAIGREEYNEAVEYLDLAAEKYGVNETMAYYAFASMKVGDTTKIEKYLNEFFTKREAGPDLMDRLEPDQEGFDARLAISVILASKGNHEQALSELRRTNSEILHTRSRYLFTRYQIMEIARLLYSHTGQEIYREFALDLAHRNVIIEPIQSYSASFVAMLSRNPNERVEALAKVLRLDPGSRSIKWANAEELEDARELLRTPASEFSHSADMGI